MLNDGCGLCIELLHDDKTDRSLYVKCYKLDEDVLVKLYDPSPYVVATPDTETSWIWGHYFADFNDAYEYLMKGEI